MSLSGLKDTITVTSQFLSHGPAAMCFAAVALAVGLAAAVLAIPAAAGPAQPGPQAPGNAQDLIAALKSRGDQVIINRSGPVKPLSECVATSVRVGRHIYKQVPQGKGPAIRSLDSHVMYVMVQC
ncbi:hypothetical protein D2E71_14465 [Mycobacteroides abscessus]|uniref:hypothetical protein n=1 Tax=Mycobacteroides abscessus TaxID=36809 RepID=UPI0009276EF1|nr:hypothetical protein [Mycobacteroides abscessus]MDO3105739.1 hypothetical protein [Mycobacteroides abscessus subsp. abscessus]RIQ98606.1 hypothetical protein D2E35_20145 [Mycobacteroides abscessus]RIR38224.1 hypothetical protein D2E38_05910 [Mycobacteroides abscessus]RIR42202.1 hypothetical protein D2E36_11155 [Mycobacteroides abscessus]RIS42822.1 hypothetical protein D2E71_14465 [Mycobacteroides abscessus]